MIEWTHDIDHCERCQSLIREEGYTREELELIGDKKAVHRLL